MFKYKKITLIIISVLVFFSNAFMYAESINDEEVFIKNGSRDKKLIALTFDDGPHPKETNQVLDVLIKLTGKKPTLFRPPYGSYKQEELASIAKKLNYKIVLWTTVDARDWQNPAAEVIANKIINNAKNGDIILLHDYATNNTVAALDILIPKMIEKGFEFVTVSEIIDK